MWLLIAISEFLGRRLEVINIVGGGAASDVWCQIFADVLDRPMRQVRDPIQTNARGAAFIAAVGLGLMSYDDIPERVVYEREYRPTAAHRVIYDAHFREFVNIYRRNRGIYRRLNGRSR